MHNSGTFTRTSPASKGIDFYKHLGCDIFLLNGWNTPHPFRSPEHRRAPGAVNHLRDCIDLFEEYGWDWTYHAYREWDGGSVEHGVNRAGEQTKFMTVPDFQWC
jgi:hypothetical protein